MAFRVFQRNIRISLGISTLLQTPRHSSNPGRCRILGDTFNFCRYFGNSQVRLDTFYENLDRIREDAATNHRIARINFEDIIAGLPEHQTSPENLLFLMKSCSTFLPDLNQKERRELVGKIWDFINKSRIPSSDDYILLLQVMRKNRQCILDYKAFLNDLRTPASAGIYEELLYLAAECNLIEEVFKILGDMKEKGYPATENVFNALILAHSRNRDLKNVELVLETMAAANVEPTPATVMELIKAYVENGTLDRALGILRRDGVFLNAEQLLTIVKTSLNSNVEQSFVAGVLKYLPEDIFIKREIHSILRNLLTELVYEGKWNKALDVLNSLPKPVFHAHEDIDGYATFLINDMIKKGCTAEDVVAFCTGLVTSERNKRSLHVAIEIALRRSSPIALDLMQELSLKEDLKPHYFWPLIIRAASGGEQAILKVITQMSKLGVPPDAETLNLYILPRLTITLKNITNAIKILEDAGVKMSQMLTPLASHLLVQRRFQEAFDIVKMYQTKVNCEALLSTLVMAHFHCPQMSLLGKIVALFGSRSEVPFDFGGRFLVELVTNRSINISHEHLGNIIKEFFLCGVKITQMAADIVEQFLDRSPNRDVCAAAKQDLRRIVDKKMNNISHDVAQHITHPRDMTLEELECHLVELEAKKLNTRGVLRRLLQLNVQKNKLDRAIEVKKLCDERKVDMSPGMLASIFDLHVKTKNIKEAEWTWLELKKKYPGFAVDEHKVIDFAALLVAQGFPAEAKKVLTMRAATKIRGGSNTLKNTWMLLNNVAQYAAKVGKAGDTRAFLRFLVDLKYCEYHNALLGPVVREFMLRRDLPKAMEEFKAIAQKWKKTPLKLELMTLILEISNGKHSVEDYGTTQDALPGMMEEIVAAVTKVYGAPNAQMTLIFALAEGGTDSQLRKLLIDPQIRINQELFQKQCDYLSNAHKVEPLIRLARCTRGLGYLIQEQDMYDMLLNSFLRDNNHEGALKLFEKICEEDELKLSRNFVDELKDLLTKNNIEIPTRLVLHAKARN